MKTINRILGLIREKRLPYSWSQKIQTTLYKKKLDDCLSKITATQPIACNKASCTELHLQTSINDFHMAILAIKSLLRFESDFAVVVHDDGSLHREHHEILTSHILNSRIITPSQADAEAEKHPEAAVVRDAFLSRFDLPIGFENRAKSRQQKVFDLHLTSNSDTVIYLDSDTIFIRKPIEILNWIANQSHSPFYARPEKPNLLIEAEDMLNVFENLTVIDTFNSGLFGFRKSQIPLSLVLDCTKKLLQEPQIKIFGDESVWRIIFGLTQPSELPFRSYPLFTTRREYRRFITDPNLRYLHFLGKHRDGVYQEVAEKCISELNYR